jgi:putative transposase
LQWYDYSQAGGYYVTIVTQGRERLFGEIVGEEMRLNPFGEIIKEEWLRSAKIRHEITLDAFVVMPNHIHAIVFIHAGVGDRPVAPTGKTHLSTWTSPKIIGCALGRIQIVGNQTYQYSQKRSRHTGVATQLL